MTAYCLDFSSIKHDYSVSVLNACDTLGYNKLGRLGNILLHCASDKRICTCINGAGAVVEDQHTRLLEDGTDKVRLYLTSKAHEHEDFALRRNRILTDEILNHNADPQDFLALMCYDIAFYKEFENSDDFMAECEKYLTYFPEGFKYGEIRFLGLDEGGDFNYCAIKGDDLSLSRFNKDDFVKYKKDNDTSKYWDILE